MLQFFTIASLPNQLPKLPSFKMTNCPFLSVSWSFKSQVLFIFLLNHWLAYSLHHCLITLFIIFYLDPNAITLSMSFSIVWGSDGFCYISLILSYSCVSPQRLHVALLIRYLWWHIFPLILSYLCYCCYSFTRVFHFLLSPSL